MRLLVLFSTVAMGTVRVCTASKLVDVIAMKTRFTGHLQATAAQKIQEVHALCCGESQAKHAPYQIRRKNLVAAGMCTNDAQWSACSSAIHTTHCENNSRIGALKVQL